MCVGEQGPAHASDQQGHQDGWERQHHVAQAHQHGIDPAAPKAGQQTQAHAHDHRQQHRRQAHHQRDAGAVDQCRKNVTALIVRAEQIFGGAMLAPGGWQARIAQFERGQVKGVVRCHPAGKDRAEHAHQCNQGRHHRHGRGAEAVANVAVEPAGKCFFHRKNQRHPPAHQACGLRALRSTEKAKRETAWNQGRLIHLKYMKLSASCTSLTFLFTPQASACWCSGMWPTSAACRSNASLM